ncbi:hypothetical protein GCM10009863_49350 [Streptomyces axinellae]|uniref:Uncharacterized protein n=1 Tax=Streptomyces axinellae TaxID=552788 RepID=A0ABP6CWQ3_9ACTN
MADEDGRRRQGQGLGSNNPYGAQAQQHWAEVEAARQDQERQRRMLERLEAVGRAHVERHGPVVEEEPGQTAAPPYQTLPPSGAPQVTDTVRAGIDQQQWAQWQRDQSQWAERTLDPNAAAAAAAAAESMEPQYQPTQYPAAGYPSAAPPDYQTYAGPSQGYSANPQQSPYQGHAGNPQPPQVQQYGGPTLSPEQVAYYAQQAGQSSSHSGDEFEPDELAAAALPEFHPGFQAAQSPMSPTRPPAPAPLAPTAPSASNAPWIDESTLSPQQIAWIQSQMGSQGQGQAPAPQPQSDAQPQHHARQTYEGAWSLPVPQHEGQFQAYTGVPSQNPLAAQARESSRQAGGGRDGTAQPEDSVTRGLSRARAVRYGQNTGMGANPRGRGRGSGGAGR